MYHMIGETVNAFNNLEIVCMQRDE